jgi:aminopeptidase S
VLARRLPRFVAAAVLAVLLAAPPAGASALSASRAKALVEGIAALGPRPAGSLNESRAGKIVVGRFRALGYEPRIQPFRLPDGRASRNIVAGSRGPLRVVLVAHLDGVSEGPAANDNGSGVAALLETASSLRGRRGVLFAALGAEERVETGSHLHLGSVRLLQSLPRSVRSGIRLALSLDMVGVGTRLTVRGLEARPNRSARLALRIGRALAGRPVYLRDSGVSDHAEMTRGSLPAALVTWRWDRCWHAPCDTASRVSGRKLIAVARLAAVAARSLLP